MSGATLKLGDVTIAIITALSHEHAAVRGVFGCGAPVVPQGAAEFGITYSLARVPSKLSGEHVVAVARLVTMGTNSAAILAVRVKSDCPKVKHLIMCGIAGAVPNPSDPETHVRLGDIVVSGEEGVIQYDFGKETSEGLQPRPLPRPPGPVLLRAVRLLEDIPARAWEATIKAFVEANGDDWKRPPEAVDCLYDSSDPPVQVLHPIDPARRAGVPRVFVGTIASGNLVQKNAKRRDELRDRYRVIAFEMEGSGIADAAWQLGLHYLIVRATCDYCDPAKDNCWQKYAAVAAAAYCRAVIENMAADQPISRLEGNVVPDLREARGELPTQVADEVRDEFASRISNVRTHAPSHLTTPATSLSRAPGRVAVERARDLKSRIEDNLAVLEVEKAFRSAQDLEEILLESLASFPTEDAAELYVLLARVEMARDTTARREDVIARARVFLQRARDVSTK